MGWYQVVKTIKGHRYLYAQRTWREGKRVRTESRYIGPADVDGGRAPEKGDRAKREPEPVNTTIRTLFHGSRVGIDGVPEASEQGTFGPGFYLSSKERAERYASHTAKTAANPEAYGSAGERFEGSVYAVEIGHLNLNVLSWNEYLTLCENLDPSSAATPAAKAKLQDILQAEGYDGLEIQDAMRPEVVVFPASVHKLRLVNTTKAPPCVSAEALESTFAALRDPGLIMLQFDPAWSRKREFERSENLVEPIEKIDNIYLALSVRTTEIIDDPSFNMRTDCINLPPKEAYYSTKVHTATERYYRTKMHELIHWSGAEDRLDRLPKLFDWTLYAREELVAEAGALLLLTTLGAAAKDVSHHATYFDRWLSRAGNRDEALAFARREAEKAVNYILTHGTTRV